MAVYLNTKTGVKVDIPPELAEKIGGYEPVDKPKRRTTKKQ